MRGDIQREDREGVTVLSVPGRFDTLVSEFLEQTCAQLAEQRRFRVVLDCTSLEFLNSIVIKILLDFHGRAIQDGGDVKLANVPLPVEDVLRLTQLDQVFRWYSSVDEAIGAF
jgi:anti-anti-sigma factor